MNTAGISWLLGGHCRGTNGSRWPHENKRKKETEKCEAETRSEGPVEVPAQQKYYRKQLYCWIFLSSFWKWLHKQPLTTSHPTGLLNWRLWELMTSPGTVRISGIKAWSVIHKINPPERQAWNKTDFWHSKPCHEQLYTTKLHQAKSNTAGFHNKELVMYTSKRKLSKAICQIAQRYEVAVHQI